MWVSQLIIKNIRVFDDSIIKFVKGLNVIVGANNSGKSTIIKSLYTLTSKSALSPHDIRKNSSKGELKISFGGSWEKYFPAQPEPMGYEYEIPSQNRIFVTKNKSSRIAFPELVAKEPYNFIYPFFSRRRIVTYSPQVNLASTTAVTGDLTHLYSKIDRISNPNFPAYNEYVQACDEILGFRVSGTASEGGKTGAYIIDNFEHIPIDAMGDGIVNILGLIVDLCVAEDKLFLIEEPENDIHPKALKNLLGLIANKADRNQFIITTHSNIVTKYLGAQPESNIHCTKMSFKNKLPTSEVKKVGTHEGRREVLEELGYELFDYDLWKGWLFLEESSAERIIREFLVPLFVPDLQVKLQTFSAHSLGEIRKKFENFNDLFVFLYLQPSYKDKIWVIVDEGSNEKEIIDKFKDTYVKKGWDERHFMQFNEHDFEKYYPSVFQEEIDGILALKDKQKRRNEKKALIEKVVAWCNEDESRTKDALKESAKEVIEILQSISKDLS